MTPPIVKPLINPRSHRIIRITHIVQSMFDSFLKDNGRLFQNQIILYGCDPLDAPCDLTCIIDGLFRINESAQLHDALVSFNTDLE